MVGVTSFLGGSRAPFGRHTRGVTPRPAARVWWSSRTDYAGPALRLISQNGLRRRLFDCVAMLPVWTQAGVVSLAKEVETRHGRFPDGMSLQGAQ